MRYQNENEYGGSLRELRLAAPAAKDPQRYHPESAIRQYLAARPVNAATPKMLSAAVHDRWAVKTAPTPERRP